MVGIVVIGRPHRFHGFNSLRHVYSRGQMVRGPLMAIKFILNNNRESYRAAVVVSRKVHKSAVVRNRIRRRIYELIRLHEQHIDKPYDIVITVFSEQIAVMPADSLRSMVDDLLKRSGIVTGVAVSKSRAIVERKENSS